MKSTYLCGVFIAIVLTVSGDAGTVQGVVVENVSGRPVARTIVRLERVAQTSATKSESLVTRATLSGHFEFPPVAPGVYILTAERDGFFPAAYGQKLPMGRGKPFQVFADSDTFAELRLRHMGAVSGRVLDENGVGAARVPVFAYQDRLPLRSAGSAASDDRGVFRISGLEPGKYWVRSGAYTLDDGSGWLPTFASQGRETRDARTYQVTVDTETTDADVIPEPGVLFRLTGVIACDTDGPVDVILSSETGRRRAQTSCKGAYKFDGLAPGVYEVYAALQDGSAAGFTELLLDHNTDGANVPVLQLPTVEFEVRRAGSNSVVNIPVRLTGRRQDLSETDADRDISSTRATLTPGHWELRAQVPSGQYVESIANQRSAPRHPWTSERAADWYEVFIEPRLPARIRITVSDQAGQIAGSVRADSKPVPGAPVFLWPVSESVRRSLGGPLQMRSNTEGRFSFDSLPPGDYRMLSTFDVNEIDAELMQIAGAVLIHADALQTTTIELPVWTGP